MADHHLRLPLDRADVRRLRAGDRVWLTGPMYTARDAAHQRLFELIQAGRELPIDLRDECIYYVGPTPAPPGRVIGAAGPTTSSRMDAYTPALLEAGLLAMVGKGRRSPAVKESIQRHGAVYFAATGGAAALLAKQIVDARVVAYEDLGPEAIYRITVVELPVFVVVDAHGADWYEIGPRQYARSPS